MDHKLAISSFCASPTGRGRRKRRVRANAFETALTLPSPKGRGFKKETHS